MFSSTSKKYASLIHFEALFLASSISFIAAWSLSIGCFSQVTGSVGFGSAIESGTSDLFTADADEEDDKEDDGKEDEEDGDEKDGKYDEEEENDDDGDEEDEEGEDELKNGEEDDDGEDDDDKNELENGEEDGEKNGEENNSVSGLPDLSRNIAISCPRFAALASIIGNIYDSGSLFPYESFTKILPMHSSSIALSFFLLRVGD
ncbi:hypothetical protein AGMMS49950_11530 [Endomicrobiia bacterium]|nr:hypothetical protein AGMMS49950_11530 [Endomicrobiia bacterium]